MHILFFEPEIDGHQASYVNSLVGYIERYRPDLRASFAIDPKLLERLDPEVRTMLETGRGGRTTSIPLSPSDLKVSLQPGLARNGLGRWSVMARYARESDAEHCCFLHIDYVMFPLMLGRTMPRRIAVSGVLLRPTTHYPELGGARREPREALRAAIKTLLYRGGLANHSLARLFSIDPYFPDYAERRYRANGRVIALPEMVLLPPEPESKQETTLDLSFSDRTVFLLFGYLSALKGIEIVLQAARKLDARTRRSVAIVFAGRLHPAVRSSFLADYQAVTEACPDLLLSLEDRFLPGPDLANLVRRADVVLIPYLRHNSCSSVIFWAAAAQKPIITQDYGLLNKLTRDFGLGITVDTRDPTALAAAITRAVDSGPTAICCAEGQKALWAGHSPDKFAQTIVEGIAGKLQ